MVKSWLKILIFYLSLPLISHSSKASLKSFMLPPICFSGFASFFHPFLFFLQVKLVCLGSFCEHAGPAVSVAYGCVDDGS